MGTSKLAFMNKIQDGFLFREDFESADFVDNDGWQTVQGVAEHSKNEVVAGKYSLLLAGTQDEDGFPVIIRKDVSSFDNFDKRMFTVWFFDDMNALLEGPFVKLGLASNRWLQIGARNAISTVNYSCNPALTSTEDSFADSGIARSAGWHKFQIRNNGSGGGNTVFELFIDDTSVRTLTIPVASLLIETIYLQAAQTGMVTDSFGYFDEVRYQRRTDFSILGVNGRRVSAGTLGSTDNLLSTSSLAIEADVVPAPNAYEVQISQIIRTATQTDNYEFLSIFLQNVDFENGDIWVISEIDFGRKMTSYQDDPSTRGSSTSAVDGTSETLTVGRLESIGASVRCLIGDEWVANSQNFFQYARQGKPFSLTLDSDDVVLNTTYVAAAAGDTILTVNNTLGVFNAEIGRFYVVEDEDRTIRQMFKASNVVGNSVYLDRPLIADIPVGSFVRSLNYWPTIELVDPQQAGLQLINPRTQRYDWNFQFREYVP